jgi:3-deoxy-manno-octulosonate cytidylyltransferase (CMP-KDO synthetase)
VRCMPSHMHNPIVLVPARMASTRLPGKPLADICGEPMIVHVWRQAVRAGVGPVVVACAESEIAAAIIEVGGFAILTRPDHPSGSDRIFEALARFDPEGRHDIAINLQGDLPTLDPDIVRAALSPLKEISVDISTLVTPIVDPAEGADPNVVKAVVSLNPGQAVGRALYFSRAAVPWNGGPLFHHIGLYAYRREALMRFVELPRGVLEQRERLEQLRALENGMRIDAAVVDTAPLGVDTQAELDRARAILAAIR